jgi:hypothetical protein
VRRGQALASPSIRYSGGELPLRAPRTVTVGIRRGQSLDVRVEAPDEVEGPVARGARIGAAVILVDGRRTATVPLRAARRVGEANGFDKVRSFAEDRWLLIAIGVFAIIVALLALRRGLRRGGREDEMHAHRELRRLEREQRRREHNGEEPE